MSNQAIRGRETVAGLSRRVKMFVAYVRGHPRVGLALGAGAAALLLLLVVMAPGRGEAVAEAALATVARGRLVIAVTENGTIRARNNVELKCEVEGQSTITYIVDEGVQVKKGDLLVELDSGELEDRLTQQQMSYEDAKAGYERATANLDITISKNESNTRKAEQNLQFAKMDLEKWLGTEKDVESAFDEQAESASDEQLEGDLDRQRKDADNKVRFAEEEMKRAEEQLRSTEELYGLKYVTKIERDADELALQRRMAEFEMAELERQLLEAYTWKKELVTLAAAVTEAEKELQRVKSEAAASQSQAESEVNKSRAQLTLQESRLTKVKEQVANTKISAPQDGLVVYPRVESWRGQEQLLQVGAQVRYRQVLIQLPDLSELVVDTKVYESDVSKLALGQKARIKVPALAQVLGGAGAPTLQGQVSKIAILPDAASRWMNPDQRVFNVEIGVAETRGGIVSKLKPEMSAEVSIILATLDDCLHVPVQAITKRGDQPVAYVVRGGRTEPVPITVGMSNTVQAQVLSGLDPGDKVLLAPPLAAAGAGQPLGLPGTEPVEAPAEGEGAGPTPPAQPAPTGAGVAPAPAAEAAGSEQPAPAVEQPTAERPSAEQREQLRRRMENASPEERQRMIEEMRQRREAGGGAAGAPGGRGSGERGRRGDPQGGGRE